MKTILFLSLLSSTIHAEITTGTWMGIINENAACYMDVGETTYLDNFENPINERVKITVGSNEYSLSHPVIFDTKSQSINVINDEYQAFLPTAGGAYAIKLKTLNNSPIKMQIMEENWEEGFKEFIECENFTKVY